MTYQQAYEQACEAYTQAELAGDEERMERIQDLVNEDRVHEAARG